MKVSHHLKTIKRTFWFKKKMLNLLKELAVTIV